MAETYLRVGAKTRDTVDAYIEYADYSLTSNGWRWATDNWIAQGIERIVGRAGMEQFILTQIKERDAYVPYPDVAIRTQIAIDAGFDVDWVDDRPEDASVVY